MTPAPPSRPGPARPAADPWSVHRHAELASTNDAAAALDPWNAVLARRQTSGRGRHDRSWVSQEGGLWLSAVVPTGPPAQGWAALPLVAGLVVCETLASLGARPLRLRWPNDVLSGHRKIAGILVEQFRPGTAVVGIGINVTNRPEAGDASLEGQVARLEDLVHPVPAVDSLAFALLGRLRDAVLAMGKDGFPALMPRVNAWWTAGMLMEIESDARTSRGAWAGVDGEGRLRLRLPSGEEEYWAAHQVVRAREVLGADL